MLARRNSKKEYLTYEIDRNRRVLEKGYQRCKFMSRIEDLFVPSIRSLVSISSIVILLETIFLVVGQRFEIKSVEPPDSLIQISFIVIVALVVFIIELLRDREDTSAGRVLLRITYIFPILLSVLIVSLFLILGLNRLFNYAVLLLTVIIFAISLTKLIDILIRRVSFFQKRLTIIKERIKESLDQYIHWTLGKAILLDSLGEQGILLNYRPFSVNADEFHILRSRKRGTITDINLKTLKNISLITESEANKNGYGFFREGIERKTFKDGTQRYLLVNFGDTIEKSSPVIAINKKYFADKKQTDKISALVNKAFVVSTGSGIDSMDELKSELIGHRDLFINALERNSSGKIAEFIQIYNTFSETLLEIIGNYKTDTRLGNAIRVSTGFGLSGKRKDIESTITWFLEYLRSVINHGLKSNEKDIISDISFLPVKGAIRAMLANDLVLYSKFIRLQVLLYEAYHENKDEELRGFIIDRTWRYIREFADFYIRRELDDTSTENSRLEDLSQYAIHLIVVYQELLKLSLRYGDLNSFALFLTKASQLFGRYRPEYDQMNVQHIDIILRVGNLSDDERDRYIVMRERQRLRESIKEVINRKRNEMFFGLAALVLNDVI